MASNALATRERVLQCSERMYFVYMLENGVWKSIGMVSKARFTAAGLITDKQYSFRVAAVGRIGEGPVSQEVTAKAA